MELDLAAMAAKMSPSLSQSIPTQRLNVDEPSSMEILTESLNFKADGCVSELTLEG